MAVTHEMPQQSENAKALAVSVEQALPGPNPFVGLRPCDIFAAVQQIGAQALRQPALVMEQEMALAREMFSIVSGGSRTAAPQGDKRFTDTAWQDNPIYR